MPKIDLDKKYSDFVYNETDLIHDKVDELYESLADKETANALIQIAELNVMIRSLRSTIIDKDKI